MNYLSVETVSKSYGPKLLFDKIIQVSKETKVRRMEWQVLDWNEPALNFYNKYNATLDGEWINGKLTNEQLARL